MNPLQPFITTDQTNWSACVTQLSAASQIQTASSATFTYEDGTNARHSMVNRLWAATSFAYDANGNLDTKTGGWDFDWNAENLMTVAKLSGVQQQAYTYDGLGRRVKVDGTSSASWIISIVSGMDVIYEKDNAGAVTKYVAANGMRIAKINPDSTVYYYLADHLGSTRKVLDANRVEKFSADYEPFGTPYNVTGTEAYKYTMEKHDDPTGLVYLRHGLRVGHDFVAERPSPKASDQHAFGRGSCGRSEHRSPRRMQARSPEIAG